MPKTYIFVNEITKFWTNIKYEIYACLWNAFERCAHRRTCFWLISPKDVQKICIFVNEINFFGKSTMKKMGIIFKGQTL